MPAGPGGESILLVEDDDDVRAFIAETLRELNYIVFRATDAPSALKILATERVDLLLTDVVLPRMSGRQLAGQGTTVLLTTQNLDEAEHLADRIAILHQGRIIANGTLAELKQLFPPAKVEYVEKQPTLEDIFLAIIVNDDNAGAASADDHTREQR